VTRLAVLDTNILVSALISSRGNPAKILDMVEKGALKPIYCEDIIKEYVSVV
jgi:predicted nucleic acid-binding protein